MAPHRCGRLPLASTVRTTEIVSHRAVIRLRAEARRIDAEGRRSAPPGICGKGFRAAGAGRPWRGVRKLPQRKRQTNVRIKTYVVSWTVTVESDSEQGAVETALDLLAAGEILPCVVEQKEGERKP